ncbi:hypothetical protein [Streptomyces cavernae]|uniref:hypothetical protein n=1 Tax=Streptomyces cavernae TaxID=2259034 RepID=UPI00192E6DEE|nr:hypothetical protein [Streptomyces cavernae]
MALFWLLSFPGTVPIEFKVNDWQVDASPADRKAVARRWSPIDVLRSAAATAAFLFAVLAVAQGAAADRLRVPTLRRRHPQPLIRRPHSSLQPIACG